MEIVCPACKEGQIEPAMALSTYCRNCGEHLKILKGKAKLSSHRHLSGLSSVRVLSPKAPAGEENEHEADQILLDQEEAFPEEVDSYLTELGLEEEEPDEDITAEGDISEPEEPGENFEDDEEIELESTEEDMPPASVAEVFGLASSPEKTEEAELDSQQDGEERSSRMNLGGKAGTIEDLTEGSMGALISDLVAQEEKRELARSVAAVEPESPKPGLARRTSNDGSIIRVRCFRCNHFQAVSKHAESTQCERCNTYVSLADYQIRQPTNRVIRTRGNVAILRKGSFFGSELACRDLLAQGAVSSRVDCSGVARIKESGTFHGHLHSEKVVVDKGADAEFPDALYTKYLRVGGTVKGDVYCAGPVEILRGAVIEGDVVAHAVDLQDGAAITGELLLDQDLSIELPELDGYDSGVIE